MSPIRTQIIRFSYRSCEPANIQQSDRTKVLGIQLIIPFNSVIRRESYPEILRESFRQCRRLDFQEQLSIPSIGDVSVDLLLRVRGGKGDDIALHSLTSSESGQLDIEVKERRKFHNRIFVSRYVNIGQTRRIATYSLICNADGEHSRRMTERVSRRLRAYGSPLPLE